MNITDAQFLSLFNKPSADAQWLNSVTSEEYFAIVQYVIQRSQGLVPK